MNHIVPLNDHQKTLVRTSFQKIAMRSNITVDLFYKRLFEMNSNAQAMFKGDTKAQRTKFMAMISSVVSSLNEPDELIKQMQALGRRHQGYGVRSEDFLPLREAMMWAFGQVLGDEFTPEAEEAWIAMYDLLMKLAISAYDE